MVGTKTCALICAYNEEKVIRSIVEDTQKYVDDVVVVDDGSKDNTRKELEYTDARIMPHEYNRGKGTALRTGFEYFLNSPYDNLITLDGDGQHLPSEIPRFIERIEQGYDVAIGERDFSEKGIPKSRKWGNKFDAYMLSKILKADIRDPQNGFRMFKKKILREVLDSSKSSGFSFELETLVKMVRNNTSIGWVPISTIYEENIESHINPVKHALGQLSLYWKAWRGKI